MIWRARLAAVAVPAHVNRDGMPHWNTSDDLVPAARMESRGVSEDDGRGGPIALPKRERYSVHFNKPLFRRHAQKYSAPVRKRGAPQWAGKAAEFGEIPSSNRYRSFLML